MTDTIQLNGATTLRTAQDAHKQVAAGEDDDVQATSCCCSGSCGVCFKIFLKYTVGRTLQMTLYVLDIGTDLSVALADYRNGDMVFAGVTLGLVFTPGLLFSLFAFTQVLTNYTGLLVCVKAPLWLLAFPVLPLWPIFRDLHQILHGLMAMCPAHRQHHLDHLNRPSRAYLLKFLEAFTEAAPQVLLRLYKINIKRRDLPFYNMEPVEMVQVGFSLATLTKTIISTYQKNVTTAQIISGHFDSDQRYKLPCFVQIMAVVWWLSFLLARFEVMALFAGALDWWIFVVIGVHVLLIFLFQTVADKKSRLDRVFIYLFSAFVFIFAYLQFNMKNRLKVASWFSYTVYTVLVFIENSVMLVIWYFTQKNFIPGAGAEVDDTIYVVHRERLILFHYAAFCLSLVMMIATFCCQARCSRPSPPRPDEVVPMTSETS